ncbi:cellulase (glycosyl hydrolase family 5) [Mycolicibacterium moriokaense]|uniref:Cellulase (Glycosyl hydrolase family 5) n=2 Tax=Mycolicibacterium moriokaense TaxID=39691 RepID=A0A318HBV3_9MYCO|nr:cellulase (glycosyl hydrolase family 5) [Mycolicibacterium moriokaense]
MNRREDAKLPRGVIPVLCSVLALALVAAGSVVVLRPSQNPGPERVQAIPVIETGSMNPSAATIGFADSDLYGKSPEDINRTLDLMRQSGVSTVRIMVPWAFVQPAPDQWDWGVVDTMVDAAQAHGISVLAALNSTPGWAAPPSLIPYTARPDSATAYGDFAAAAASRYRGRISAYEVWNEANSVLFWTPNPDPAAYTELLKAAYPRIKAADPSATVVGAGLAPVFSFGSLTLSPAEFVKGMYAAGAKGNFDALAYHPYLYTMKFSAGKGYPESPITQVTGMHQVMADNGDGGKTIWCTEYGEPTSAVDETTQADYVRDFITTWRTLPFAGPVYIYSTRDRNTGSATDQDTFGVYRTDWTPKSAQQVIQSLAPGG